MTMIEILRDNGDVILVRKPAGVSVQPGENAGRALVDILETELGWRPYLLHRLDRETEGVLALARRRETAQAFSKTMESQRARKIYLAIVFNRPTQAWGEIDSDILNRGQAQSALTRYRLLASYANAGRDYSLLELELETGRMHQIRIHLASIGCPIVGDDKHGDWKLNKEAAKTLGAKRLFLLARYLGLPSLDSGPALEAWAPWPEHFLALFRTLGVETPTLGVETPNLHKPQAVGELHD